MPQTKRKLRLVFRKYPQNHLITLYTFLKNYQDKHGYMPSKNEVALKFKTHHSTVGYWYKLMEERAMIKRNPGLARAIVLLPLTVTTKEAV